MIQHVRDILACNPHRYIHLYPIALEVHVREVASETQRKALKQVFVWNLDLVLGIVSWVLLCFWRSFIAKSCFEQITFNLMRCTFMATAKLIPIIRTR